MRPAKASGGANPVGENICRQSTKARDRRCQGRIGADFQVSLHEST